MDHKIDDNCMRLFYCEGEQSIIQRKVFKFLLDSFCYEFFKHYSEKT